MLFCGNITWSTTVFVEAPDRQAAKEFLWEVSGDFMDDPDTDIDVFDDDEAPWDSATVIILDGTDHYDSMTGVEWIKKNG